MSGFENHAGKWWVKRAVCPRGNSPHSPRLLPKFVDMLREGLILWPTHIDHTYVCTQLP